MQIKNDGRHEGFYTIRQWAKKGFLPKKGAAGTEMWSNKFCCNSFVYYTADEVERASEDALAAYWKPVRDRKAERRKVSAEAKRRETESQITALQCQVDTLTAALRRVTQFCSMTQTDTADGIVLDIETTGLVCGKDEVLQVSIISTEEKTLFHSYIKPIYTMQWKGAHQIHHISPDMVADAPDIYSEMPKINFILQNAKTIIGYNHENFDIPFLENFGAVFPDNVEYFDVMLHFAEICREWSEEYDSYKWQKLTACAAYYGYEWGDTKAHDSLSDCLATLHCYHCMNP